MSARRGKGDHLDIGLTIAMLTTSRATVKQVVDIPGNRLLPDLNTRRSGEPV